MSNTRIERPSSVIKANITPIDNTLKLKVSAAVQSLINKIKEKHLS